jgi:hypothetical protein
MRVLERIKGWYRPGRLIIRLQIYSVDPLQLSKSLDFEMKGGRGSSERLSNTSG